MKRSIFSLLGLLLLASACQKQDNPDEELILQRYYANSFAYNNIKTYYLWKDEAAVKSQIDSWSTKADPVEKVKSLRYSADKWTALMEDCSAFEGSVTGNNKTFGLDFDAYYLDEAQKKIHAYVTYTYADSPARAAGLKRGDDIRKIDGQEILTDNYQTLLGKLTSADAVELGLADGRSVKLTAKQMYENPVHTAATLENAAGKKVGYLHFTNFTLDAMKDLETVFAQFKADAISELVLDLRYNTGGYVSTATALASMIAPPDVVSRQEVFLQDVYNDVLTEYLKDTNVKFVTEYTYTSNNTNQKVTVHPLEVNPGISRLWVLTSGSSASASESIICGLYPYMDVKLVGQTTYGKYCGGILLTAKEWFDSLEKQHPDGDFDYDEGRKTIPTWGIYVITSRYADCQGITRSMPDGITPDYPVRDHPSDGIALGDPAEALLATALGATKTALHLEPLQQPAPVRRPGFGVLLH